MTTNTDADIRSPWYETFTPLMWVVAAQSEEPAAAPDDAEAAAEDWATEAIFDYYND